MYQYKAELVRVVDGDTVDLKIDLGFHMTTVQRCRLMDYDAPEMSGPTRFMGEAARDVLAGAFVGCEAFVKTYKSDSFGRYLVFVQLQPSTGMPYDLVFTLVKAGYGRRWDGKGKRPSWDPDEPYPIRSAS